MVLLEKLRKEQSVIGLIIATLVLVTIQTMFFLPQITQAFVLRAESTLIFPNSVIMIVLYSVFPIVAGVVVSWFFRPKRIVSPFFVQLGSTSIILLMITYSEASTMFMFDAEFWNLIVTAFLSLFVNGFIGFIQLRALVKIIGLELEDVTQVSYLIGEPLDEVMSRLGDDFLDVWGFSKQKDEKDIQILKMEDADNRAVVIAIGANPTDKKATVLSTVSFQITSLGIKPSKMASSMCNSIVNDIKGRLDPAGVTEKECSSENDFVESRAKARALDITKSKLRVTTEFWATIPKLYRGLFWVIICFFVVVTFLHVFEVIDFSTYASIAITAVVALFFDVGIPLAKELAKQKKSKM